MKQIFYEGDEVKHPDFGEGIVISICEDAVFSVLVKFTDGQVQSFKHDGSFLSVESPSLTFRDCTSFDYGTPPERKWIPTEACWAKVWDYGDGFGSFLKFIVGYKEDSIYPYKDLSGVIWKHAEPCDPPEWEGDTQ